MKNQKLVSFGIFLAIVAVAIVIALSTNIKQAAKNQKTSPQANNTDNSQAVETLSSTTEILSNGSKLYKNKALGFSLELPHDVSVDREFNSRANRLVTFKGGNLAFEVRLKEGQNASLDNYFYLDLQPSSTSTLGGEKARIFKAPKGYCDGPSCGDPFTAYSAKMGNDFYNLVFFGDTILNQNETKILSSFKYVGE